MGTDIEPPKNGLSSSLIAIRFSLFAKNQLMHAAGIPAASRTASCGSYAPTVKAWQRAGRDCKDYLGNLARDSRFGKSSFSPRRTRRARRRIRQRLKTKATADFAEERGMNFLLCAS